MTDAQPETAPKHRGFIAWVTVGAVAAAVACVLATLIAGLGGLVAVATIATALGTLALAWQTYALAKATRKAVAESGDELEELKAQRELLQKQADGIAAQAEASGRLAESSSLGSLAAARTRIDAVSPLIHMTARMDGFLAVDSTGQRLAVTDVEQWYDAQLKEVRFEVTLIFILKNVGNAPANLSFGDTSQFLVGVVEQKLPGVVIESGANWWDQYIVRIPGPEAVNQTELRMPFTYEGVLYAEMFDRIQWNGYITPLLMNDGVAKKADRIVNSCAQVFRSYLSLEEPDRIAKQAHVIQYGPEA